jgi:hypothetical protein
MSTWSGGEAVEREPDEWQADDGWQQPVGHVLQPGPHRQEGSIVDVEAGEQGDVGATHADGVVERPGPALSPGPAGSSATASWPRSCTCCRAAARGGACRPRSAWPGPPRTCGVPLLSQACDLGSVGYIDSDGVLELSVFNVRGAILNAFKRLSQLDRVRRRRARSEARISFRHAQGRSRPRAGSPRPSMGRP